MTRKMLTMKDWRGLAAAEEGWDGRRFLARSRDSLHTWDDSNSTEVAINLSGALHVAQYYIL